MDFRNYQASDMRKRSGAPGQEPPRNTSPFGGVSRDPGFAGRNGAGPGDSSFARSPYGGQASSFGDRPRLTSPQEQDSQARIELRHEELKRQIALKERQLAEMTNERDTAQRLRTKLGLSPSSQIDSGVSLGGDDRGRPGAHLGPMRNNFLPASQSPNQREPGMSGMRSTHLGRPTSSNRPPFDTGIRDSSGPPLGGQQLQFHPTRQQRQVSAIQHSPLRTAGSKEPVPTRTQIERSNERSISPYTRDVSGMRNTTGMPPRARVDASSPLRSTSPNRPGPMDTFNAGETSLERGIRPHAVTGGMASTAVTQGPRIGFSPGSIGAVDMKRFSGPGARGELYKDRIEAMTIDNASLQRRLNQVSQELERIHREKEDLNRNLHRFQTDNARMDGGINHKDETDMANQAMQDDLERQKEDNARLQSRLREEEVETHHVGEKLSNTNVARKNLELDADHLQSDLGQRLRHLDDLSNERTRALQDIHAATAELEGLNREHLGHNHENIDMETHIARLMAERHELLKNLEQLTITYDDCVRDITRERKNMDAQNDWQTKLIVAKIIFEHIHLCQKVRGQRAFKELSDYVGFDKDCHQKLRSFSNVVYKLGLFKMKMALNQWYDNALKPLPLRLQNDDISIVVDCNRLQAKTFYAWKQYQQTKLDRYQFKTNSIEKIWYLLNKGAKQEMKRAFCIWKEKKRFDYLKVKKIYMLLQKKNNSNTNTAMNTWRTYSNLMGHACRVRILQIEYSQKLYLSQVFSQMRTALRNQKRLRHMTLNSYVKAWKDYIAYNRHLMQKNMAAIAFGQTNRKYLLKNCFDELRQEAETAKYQAMYTAVKDDMDPAISQTSDWNRSKDRAILTKNQLRAGNITRDMLGKRLFSYFLLWKQETDFYRVTLQKKIKGRLLKIYSNKTLQYFKHWKDKMNFRVTEKRMLMMKGIETENELWHQEAMDRAADLKTREESVKNLKRRLVDKTFRKLFYRKVSVCIGRWKDICFLKDGQESKAEFVIKKMRMRMTRQAVERFFYVYKKSIQHDKNVKSAAYMSNTLNLKLLRKVFNMMCFETSRQKLARKYWNKIFNQMDHFMKKRGLNAWKHGGNIKFADDLINKQDNLIDDIQQRKDEITQFEQTDFTQEAYIEQQKKMRRNKAYRQLGNYFMRVYSSQTANKFRIWRDRVVFLKHVDGVLKKTLNHWKKSQFLMMKHVLANFMNDDRKREYIETIKQCEIDQMMINTKRQHNDEQQNKLRHNEMIVIEGINYESCKKEEEYLKLMQIIERRNKEWVFGSRKRFIFMMWRHVMKKEKAFCICVKNALTKSLYRQGLDAIQSQSKNHVFTMRTNRTLKKFIDRFMVLNGSDAFTMLKKNALYQVERSKKNTFNEKIDKINEFEEWRRKTKDTNAARCLRFFVERNNQNIWNTLVHATKHLKLVRAKTNEFHERQVFLRRKFAVQRWHSRFMKTRFCISRKSILVRRIKWQYVRTCFYAIKQRWQNTKHLCASLSNLEKLMRDKTYGDSFKAIQTYAISKGLVFNNNKKKAADHLQLLVKNSILKRYRIEFQKLKNKTHTDQKKCSKLKNAYGHACTIRLRDAFDWWKRRHDLAELKVDLYDSGPVRAQHWLAMREIDNLKELMQQEHYTPKEIHDTCKRVFGRNDHLMEKYIKRIRLTQDRNKKLLPAIWNRWRQFVGMRKLIKYQFQFMENNTSNVKSDLQRAFRKWKNGPEQLGGELSKLEYNVLSDLAIKASKQVADCGDTMSENQSIQNHLLIQRDEFLNYYVKSQVLAMALIKDRNTYAKQQAWSRWLWKRKNMNKEDMDNAIRDSAYMQANLEARQADFNSQNEFLASENAELGQFSDDGAVIRRNMERLNGEVEGLRIRWSDATGDYEELMAENERLRRLLEQGVGAQKKDIYLQSYKIKVEAGDKANMSGQAEGLGIQETDAQKAQKDRFNKLKKLSQGAGLR